jgi:hypothetical protein
MVDVAVSLGPMPPSWIRREIAFHVLMNFFLQVDADSPINTDDFIRANPGVGWNVAIRIGDAYVGGVISNGMARSLQRSADQPSADLCAARR